MSDIVKHLILALQTQADVATLRDPNASPFEDPVERQREFNRARNRVMALGENKVRELLDV